MRPHIEKLIADREKGMPETEFEKFMRISVEDKSVISLGPGEPDFDAPKNVKEAAKRSIDRNHTHYSTPAGLKSLREAVSKKLKIQNGIDANPEEEMIVTTGSSEGLLLASMVLVEPGDRIVVPNPGYVDYAPTTMLLEGSPVSMNVLNKNGFDDEVENLRKKVDDRTHVLILNSPSNPTGGVMRRKELEEIADIVNEHNMVVFSDEAYESFVYGDLKHTSMASLDGMEEKTVSFYSFSKTYAMAGFRVGYAVGPEKIVSAMKKIRLYSTLSNPVFTQEAALEALEGPQKEVERMKKEYGRRGKMLHRRLGEIGNFVCNKPEGAFYMFPETSGFDMKSADLSRKILEEAKVLVVPGTEFGENGEGHVRMSYATSYEKIQEAMDRIQDWTRKI